MQVRIVETAHHFLYLPVQYAVREKCFGCVPDRYEIDLEIASPKTDRAAYQALMRGATANQDGVRFAIADPAVLLNDPDTHLFAPVVLAGLITNSSFWAIDRRTHQVRFLRDLGKFDTIIAFPEGTTSHGIAKRIYADINKTPSIVEVEPGTGAELTRLTTSQKGTMALTPDLLGIDTLMAEHPDLYYVDLALGATPEYNNVLVTALLSRIDVVQGHPDLVRGLVAAIQHAMLLVRLGDPKVIKFAKDSHGKNEANVIGALGRAADAQVFPATIEASRAHWMNAAKAAADAASRVWDEAEHDRAVHLFRSTVEPYQGSTREAIRSHILPRLENSGQDNQQTRWEPSGWLQSSALGLASGAVLGVVFAWWLAWPLLAISIALCGVGVWLSCRLPMNTAIRTIHLSWLLVALGIGVWWTASLPAKGTVEVVLPLWVGVEATIVLTAAALEKKQNAQ